MTDKERLIRDERVKLRRAHDSDREEIKRLERCYAMQTTRINELVHQLEISRHEVATWKEAYERLCTGLGQKGQT